MTFQKPSGPKIVRLSGPQPRLTISPPKQKAIAKEPTAQAVAPSECVCQVDAIRWATLSNVAPSILTEDLAYTDTIVTATIGRLSGTNDAIPMAPYLFYAGFVDADGNQAVICPGEAVTWSYEWSEDPTTAPSLIAAPNTQTLLVHLGYFYENIDGDAVPNNMFRNIEAGILSVSANVCSQDFGPINLTIEVPPDPYYEYDPYYY